MTRLGRVKPPIRRPATDVRRKPLGPGVVIAAVGAFAIVIFILGLVINPPPPPPPPQPCDDAKVERKQVNDALTRGDYAVARGIAEGKLTGSKNSDAPAICDEARTNLAGQWYEAGMRELFSTQRPAYPDNAFDKITVIKWTAIEAAADGLINVPPDRRWAAITVAQTAYNSGFWALAHVSFLSAWDSKSTGREQVGLYYALLRNWGHELLIKGNPDMQASGKRLLGTAYRIARAVRLVNDPACGEDLAGVGFSDCNSAPYDPEDNVLKVLEAKR